MINRKPPRYVIAIKRGYYYRTPDKPGVNFSLHHYTTRSRTKADHFTTPRTAHMKLSSLIRSNPVWQYALPMVVKI